MKKLMILGGGPNQIPLIKAAKKNGYYVIVADYNENAVGVAAADELCLVSIMDKDGVLAAAEKLNLDGIISNSEPAMPVVAYVGNELGLPSNDFETIAAMTDKFLFRTMLKNKGFVVPGFGAAKTYEEAKALFEKLKKPVMIKPGASSGSRGVEKLESEEQLKAAFDNAKHYSRNGSVILEEYIYNICGHVTGGDIFVSEGEIVFFGLMSCIRDIENMPLVPKGEMYPAVLSTEQLEKVRQELSRAVKEIGIRFGAINVEIMIDTDGNVCFIELNPRNGGNFIPEELMAATGFDIFDASVRAATGENVPKHEAEYEMPYATYMVSTNRSGRLKSISFSEEIKPFIEAYIPDAQQGDEVEPFINADKRVGVLMLSFESVEMRNKIVDDIDGYVLVDVV